MTKTLSITELCRRTGLSSRTLRFYDARGLVVAQRTASGLRCYGPSEVARLHQVSALKRAGFSLAQIGTMLGDHPLDLGRLIDAQLEALEVERDRVDEAVASLKSARARLDAGRAIDIDTFCTLIKQGEQVMADTEAWTKVANRYYTPEEQARWASKMPPPGDFDQQAYMASWVALGERIEAAMPMDPASEQARAFADEWNKLLEPFTKVATSEMMSGASKLYDNMGEWQTEMKPPFSMKVWQFMKEVAAARPNAAG